MKIPHVILNSAMSLDGKIAKFGERIKFSNEKDKKRVHGLRKKVDAIMVGINTIIVDNPKLTAHHAENYDAMKNPVRIIVDSNARIPLESNVLKMGAGKTIVAVSKNAPESRIEHLKKLGAEVIVCGENEKVDLRELLVKLKNENNIKKILLEGGGTLNKEMLKEGLIDEIFITVAPTLIGYGVSIINGKLENEIKLKLEGIKQLDEQVVFHYFVEK